MTNTKDIIIRLKEVREEKGYSYNDILKLMEDNGDYLAKSTLSKVFSDGSEEKTFMYEETIRPIAKALLDIENIEETDDMDVKAMKALLKYKMKRIEELETALDKEKIRYHERLDFLNNQIVLKDKRIDNLLDTTTKLLNQLLDCPCRFKNED